MVLAGWEATAGAESVPALFAGAWNTSYPPSSGTGTLNLQVSAEAQGQAAVAADGGPPGGCPAPTVYYTGSYTSGSDSGQVAACTKDLQGLYLAGWYGGGPNGYHGRFDVNTGCGNLSSFSGTYNDASGSSGNYAGTRTSGPPQPCGGSGTPPSVPGITPISTPPSIGTPTLYEPPAPGADASYQLPKLAKNNRDLEGTISFVDNQGNPVEGPDLAAVEAQAERAGVLCYTLAASVSQRESNQNYAEIDLRLPGFATCADAVSRVLARADELKRKRAQGARATAAGRVCRLRVRGRRATHSPLRVRCTATATGLIVDIRPRSSRQTLAGVLGHHAPKLIVGRSAITPGPAGLRLKELWHAKGRR
jgi:hypothetical protein